MKKETLELKKAGELPVTSDRALADLPTVAGKNTSSYKPRQLKSDTKLLEAAIDNRVNVYIQLRHGAGYRGMPTLLENGWLTLTNADIHGTKQNMHVAELVIQVKDGSYIAHLHICESQQHSNQMCTSLGDLK